MAKVFKILPTTQQYDWGKIGANSKVAQFAAASGIPGFVIDDESPYAELWMGTHPTSPSRVRATNELLSDHLARNLHLIGRDVVDTFDTAVGGNLPFLFKVLSIEKALSIQTHPDKRMAEELHKSLPGVYKDPNHKPELAIAITPFRALCGFRPLPEIATYLHSTPELNALIPSSITTTFVSQSHSTNPAGAAEKSALKDLFASLMTADEQTFQKHLAALVARYRSGKVNKGEDDEVVQLVLKLDGQFPGDIGVFCAFMLNAVYLNPGEAIFLGAGEPHAYISGECIECMANSDNVIRAGLTPKLRDIPNLVCGLTYKAAPPSKHVVSPTPWRIANSFASDNGGGSGGGAASASSPKSTKSKLYDPPIPEFSVVQVTLPLGQRETHRRLGGPSVCVVTSGGGRILWGEGEGEGEEKERKEKEILSIGLGDVFFVGADTEVEFEVLGEGGGEGEEGLVIYRAFVENTGTLDI